MSFSKLSQIATLLAKFPIPAVCLRLNLFWKTSAKTIQPVQRNTLTTFYLETFSTSCYTVGFLKLEGKGARIEDMSISYVYLWKSAQFWPSLKMYTPQRTIPNMIWCEALGKSQPFATVAASRHRISLGWVDSYYQNQKNLSPVLSIIPYRCFSRMGRALRQNMYYAIWGRRTWY